MFVARRMYAFQASEPDSRPPPVSFSPPNAPPISAPAGADVDVGDAAVGPGRRQEQLRLAHVVGEHRRRQALRHGVVQARSPRRSRGTRSRTGSVRTSPRRTTAVGRGDLARWPGGRSSRRPARPAGDPLAAGDDAAGLRLAAASAACIRSNAPPSMSGPTSTPRSRGSPTGSAGEHGLQPLDQVADDRLVHDQPPQRRTPLAAGAGGGEGDRPHGQIQVGRRGDDHGVVAAEFQQRAARAARRPAGPPPGPSRVEPVR